jgi:hypothetical protein
MLKESLTSDYFKVYHYIFIKSYDSLFHLIYKELWV